MFVVKVIAAFFLPPVTAYLQVGVSTHFWISIALTMLGWLPGVLHALWLVFTDAAE
ncbi:MAG: YqaE/Pmp3 family membrane protein [Myxococcota bacterium]|nr:YqaE/Pmp3 family membrane protein [Myxococcota bacterium]